MVCVDRCYQSKKIFFRTFMKNTERIQKFLAGESANEIDGWFFPLDQRAFLEKFSVQNQLRITGDVVEVAFITARVSFCFLC